MFKRAIIHARLSSERFKVSLEVAGINIHVKPHGLWLRELAKELCGVLRRDKSVTEHVCHLHWLTIGGFFFFHLLLQTSATTFFTHWRNWAFLEAGSLSWGLLLSWRWEHLGLINIYPWVNWFHTTWWSSTPGLCAPLCCFSWCSHSLISLLKLAHTQVLTWVTGIECKKERLQNSAC